MRFSSVVAALVAISISQALPLKKRVKAFKFFGVNESGAEFGQNNIPGTLNTDYTFPSNSSLSVLCSSSISGLAWTWLT